MVLHCQTKQTSSGADGIEDFELPKAVKEHINLCCLPDAITIQIILIKDALQFLYKQAFTISFLSFDYSLVAITLIVHCKVIVGIPVQNRVLLRDETIC